MADGGGGLGGGGLGGGGLGGGGEGGGGLGGGGLGGGGRRRRTGGGGLGGGGLGGGGLGGGGDGGGGSAGEDSAAEDSAAEDSAAGGSAAAGSAAAGSAAAGSAAGDWAAEDSVAEDSAAAGWAAEGSAAAGGRRRTRRRRRRRRRRRGGLGGGGLGGGGLGGWNCTTPSSRSRCWTCPSGRAACKGAAAALALGVLHVEATANGVLLAARAAVPGVVGVGRVRNVDEHAVGDPLVGHLLHAIVGEGARVVVPEALVVDGMEVLAGLRHGDEGGRRRRGDRVHVAARVLAVLFVARVARLVAVHHLVGALEAAILLVVEAHKDLEALAAVVEAEVGVGFAGVDDDRGAGRLRRRRRRVPRHRRRRRRRRLARREWRREWRRRRLGRRRRRARRDADLAERAALVVGRNGGVVGVRVGHVGAVVLGGGAGGRAARAVVGRHVVVDAPEPGG